MGRVSIDTQQCEIKKIFSDDFVFTIPLYQRPYAWTTEEAGVLLEDLLAAMGEGKQDMEEVLPYFLGSIVLTKGDKPEAEVIDGQQRLITITILLAALRASIKTEHARDLDHFLYERANTFARTPSRYRLTLRKRDAEFFQRYIQTEGGIESLKELPLTPLTESQRNIRDNAQAFMQRLWPIPDEDRIRLGEFLVSNCFMVVISTADFNTSYRIFSVLNNRGLSLSPADILKAQVIGDIPPDEQDEYTNKWEEIEVSLGRENFENLLSLIRVLWADARVQKNLLEEFHAHVYPNSQLRMTPQDLIDRLLIPYGSYLQAILATKVEKSPYAAEIEELLRWLNKLTHTEWLPAVLQYWGRYSSQPELLLRFLKDLDRLSVGLLLLDLTRNKRSERYRKLQMAIKHKEDVYTDSSPLQLTESEQRAIYKTLDGNLYDKVTVGLCKYVLLRLDTLLSDGTAKYDLPVISVEHVLPQKPVYNSEWTRWFPKDKHNHYLHRLGNLVLLSRQKNSDANNYDFEKKKKVYFSKNGYTPFVLTSHVLFVDQWTPNVVERRQRELVNKLAIYWRFCSP
jgi:hypothetical protein